MKSFKYTINGNVYKVHINSVVDDIAELPTKLRWRNRQRNKWLH